MTLQPPINGKVAFSCGYSFGSEATLTCNKGFRIVGSRQRSCREGGLWSGDMTICKSKLLRIEFSFRFLISKREIETPAV